MVAIGRGVALLSSGLRAFECLNLALGPTSQLKKWYSFYRISVVAIT